MPKGAAGRLLTHHDGGADQPLDLRAGAAAPNVRMLMQQRTASRGRHGRQAQAAAGPRGGRGRDGARRRRARRYGGRGRDQGQLQAQHGGAQGAVRGRLLRAREPRPLDSPLSLPCPATARKVATPPTDPREVTTRSEKKSAWDSTENHGDNDKKHDNQQRNKLKIKE